MLLTSHAVNFWWCNIHLDSSRVKRWGSEISNTKQSGMVVVHHFEELRQWNEYWHSSQTTILLPTPVTRASTAAYWSNLALRTPFLSISSDNNLSPFNWDPQSTGKGSARWNLTLPRMRENQRRLRGRWQRTLSFCWESRASHTSPSSLGRGCWSRCCGA